MRENQFIEKKSLSVVLGKSANWKELAKDCVCFANSRGGLIGIESHRLEELIYQDIKIYQPTSLGEIHERIGKEISKNQVRKTLYKMVHSDKIHRSGNTNGARYYLVQNL